MELQHIVQVSRVFLCAQHDSCNYKCLLQLHKHYVYMCVAKFSCVVADVYDCYSLTSCTFLPTSRLVISLRLVSNNVLHAIIKFAVDSFLATKTLKIHISSKGGRGDHEVASVGRPATTNKVVVSPFLGCI